ncbi:TonB-dependent receptor [Elizabethkingia argentiflava]|uniref:TonB-dependent receptor n=1 Tax=Elizabethkingia argenteiflava TaxID=2681556 RepID=A0A845PZE3_9FLAO|nr:TonB-dependent receptor [Elizabethkingia argenteiflava]NAW52271.1 TonB-dependent receptor [Elizabethkingia argenteiflava]
MKKAIFMAGLLVSVTLFAQQTSADSSIQDKDMDELIVHVNRIPEIKTNSAATVTIISEKQIKEMGKISQDVSQIIGMAVPGLALASNTTSNRSQTLRGRSMLLLIDGIPQSTPLRATDRDIRTIDPAAIERIEVVNGATSIYGNGAIGGVINIITKKNKEGKTFGGQTSFSTTDHDYFDNKKRGFGYRFNQQFYGKKDKFNYLINGTINQTGSAVDGDGEYISPRYGLGDTRTLNLLTKIGYDFNQKNSIEAMYNYYSSTQNTPLVAEGGIYGQSPRIGVIGTKNPNAQNEGTRYNHNAYIKYTSKDIFRNSDLEVSAFAQSLYTVFDYREHNPKKPRWQSTSGQATIRAKKYGLRGQMVSRVNFSDQVKTQFLYGVDYLVDQTSQPLVDKRLWVPEITSYNIAPFLQTKTTFWGDLNLKLGVRYDHINVDVPDYNILPKKDTDPQVHVKGGNLKYDNTSWNVGLSYNRLKELQPFVAYSRGFSIFDLGRTLRDAAADQLSKIETSPVKTDNYEVGAYSQIGNFLSINAAYFYTHSQLGSDLVSKAGFWVVDRSPQKVSGVEVGTNVRIIQELDAGLNFTTFEGRKKSEGSRNWDGYMSGLSIPASKTTMYLSFKPVKQSYFNLYYIHTGTRDRFTLNSKGVYNEGEGKVNPIDLFNFSSGYTLDKITYGIAVENLFNKSYYTPVSMLVARNTEYARGNGRYITLSMTYKF